MEQAEKYSNGLIKHDVNGELLVYLPLPEGLIYQAPQSNYEGEIDIVTQEEQYLVGWVSVADNDGLPFKEGIHASVKQRALANHARVFYEETKTKQEALNILVTRLSLGIYE